MELKPALDLALSLHPWHAAGRGGNRSTAPGQIVTCWRTREFRSYEGTVVSTHPRPTSPSVSYVKNWRLYHRTLSFFSWFYVGPRRQRLLNTGGSLSGGSLVVGSSLRDDPIRVCSRQWLVDA